MDHDQCACESQKPTSNGAGSKAVQLHAPPPPPSIGLLLMEVLGFYGHVFEPKVHALVGCSFMGPPPPGCGFAAMTCASWRRRATRTYRG